MAASGSKRPRRFYNAMEAVRLLNEDESNIPTGSEEEEEELSSEGDEDMNIGNEELEESSDENSSTSNDEDAPSLQPRSSVTRQPITWHWIKKDLPPIVNPQNQLLPKGPALHATTPLEMFSAHFDDECFELLTLESNRYRLQQSRTKMKAIEVEEMRIVVGACLFMSIVNLPTKRMYWAPYTRQPVVADAITNNRFEEILSVLHCNDNELESQKGTPGYDRLHKVRPLLLLLSESFRRCAEPEVCVSVDEQIIPFKGRHGLKVYMMKKPKKWGYKVWVLAGQSGYVHKFTFAGDNTVCDDIMEGKTVGKAGQVVIRLTEHLPKGSFVYFDNYFSSPELLSDLRRMGQNATCTIQANRTRNCPLMCQKDLKKRGRGAFDFRQDEKEGILLCEWYDNRIVYMASNVHSVQPTNMVRRYDRKAKQYIHVPCPALIKNYNENMGGVDKCDMLLSLYRTGFKSTKWYKRIIFHLIDLCIINSWLLYRELKSGVTIQLSAFKLDVAKGLLSSQRSASAPIPHIHSSVRHPARNVNIDARFDGVEHFPQKMNLKNAQRCKNAPCNRKTMFQCRKCEVFLCLVPKDQENDCFFQFHHK